MDTIWTAARSLLYASGFVTVSLYVAFAVRNLDARLPAIAPHAAAGLLLIASGLAFAIVRTMWSNMGIEASNVGSFSP